jgi:hypothetical protein
MKNAIQVLIEHVEKSTKIKFKDTSKSYFDELYKRQIIDAIEHVLAGFIINKEVRYKIAEKYYNDTYSGDKNEEQSYGE